MHRIGVYGTLRRGFGNWYRYLERSKQIGSTWVNDYVMFHLGGFPCVVPFEGRRVFVEVYEIDALTLVQLDRLEGYYPDRPDKGWYQRKTVHSHLLGNFDLYQMELATAQAFSPQDQLRMIPGGKWEGPQTETNVWLGEEEEIKLVKAKAVIALPDKTIPIVDITNEKKEVVKQENDKSFTPLRPEDFGVVVEVAKIV